MMIDLNESSIIIEYNGCGDDGYIESISIRGKEYKELKEYPYQVKESIKGPDDEYHNVLNQKLLSPNDFLEEFAYDVIGNYESGWEIDDGSTGEINLNITDGELKVKMHHYGYYRETEDTETVY